MESETTPTRDNFIPKDDDGQSRTMSDTVGQRPTLSPTDGDWLTTDKIVLRLAEKFGVHRDRRSAERYCQNEKVKAFFDDAQNIWFAEQESVDRLGAQLKEIQDRQEKSSVTTVDKPDPADTELKRLLRSPVERSILMSALSEMLLATPRRFDCENR